MNKNEYINKINNFKISKNSKKLFLEQIELFFNCENSKVKNYNIGDEIIIHENNLIHGTRASIEELKKISEYGLISSEFYSKFNKAKKKPYVVETWMISCEIKLSDWIKKYTGVTIDFKDRTGKTYKSVICSFDDIKSMIKIEENFRDYIIYQNMEQRFLPNDYINNDTSLAFILEFNKEDRLIKNDIFDENFDKNILKNILPKWFYKKYMKNRLFDNYEPGREKAIIFGIPRSMIKGIIIPRAKENDAKYLEEIHRLFTNCYICNLDGIVIK